MLLIGTLESALIDRHLGMGTVHVKCIFIYETEKGFLIGGIVAVGPRLQNLARSYSICFMRGKTV